MLASLLGFGLGAADATVALRGFEASVLRGSGHLVSDATAPDGQALVLTGREVGSAVVDTVAARAVQVTAAAGCRGLARLQVRVDELGPRVLVVSGTGWTRKTLDIGLQSGRHRVRLSLAGGAGRCGSVRIDRVDFLPSASSEQVLLGSAVRASDLFGNALYRNTWLDTFQSMTPENETELWALEPGSGDFQFATADAMVNLAIAHGKQVRGHALVWGNQLPLWLYPLLFPYTSSSLRSVMQSYIQTVIRNFGERVDTWDVVNEAFGSNGRYVHNLWFDTIGPSYIADAFRFAAAADPSAQLFYNDNGAETWGPKQQAILAMVRSLRAQGVPIDGVGFETHLPVGGSVDESAMEATFERFAALGVTVEITEMDVPLSTSGPPTAPQLAGQAAVYRGAATACWDVAVCHSFTTWGFSDAVTWLGSATAPLLFNSAYDPKPALAAVEQALHLSSTPSPSSRVERGSSASSSINAPAAQPTPRTGRAPSALASGPAST